MLKITCGQCLKPIRKGRHAFEVMCGIRLAHLDLLCRKCFAAWQEKYN